ncbi:MAG: DUF2956 domain-containing protein [bacterium]
MAINKTKVSKETIAESAKLAKANQRPGQTKQQTKIIALGIQKGIEQYKKQHKSKSRNLNKKLKEVSRREDRLARQSSPGDTNEIPKNTSFNFLPWVLLVISWLGFAGYLVIHSRW